MMRIEVSFHTPVFWRAHWIGLLCLGGGALLTVVVLGLGWHAYAQRERWNADLQSSKLVRSDRSLIGADDEKAGIRAELEAANQIVERLNTPWASLFASLETVFSEDAILLGVEPDPESRTIRLTAEAKNTNSMLEFVRQLRASKVLADSHVITHQINQQDIQRPIRFSVASHWLDLPPVIGQSEQVPDTAPVAETQPSLPEQPVAAKTPTSPAATPVTGAKS